MSNNTILGTKPFSDYMSVVEAASLTPSSLAAFSLPQDPNLSNIF